MHKCKTLISKIHVLKYVLKYKIQSTEHLADLTTSLLLYLDGDTEQNTEYRASCRPNNITTALLGW